MFRKELETKLKGIFGLEKITFNSPSDSFEQDTLFVEVANCSSRARQGRISGKITGSLVTYSQHNKRPYGFFNKRIALSNPELTRNFFFTDMDQEIASSPARMVNLSERRCGFVYLYSDQFDPQQGQLTSLSFGEGDMPQSEGLLDIGDGNYLDVGDGRVLET